jgi:hypothetical protein
MRTLCGAILLCFRTDRIKAYNLGTRSTLPVVYVLQHIMSTDDDVHTVGDGRPMSILPAVFANCHMPYQPAHCPGCTTLKQAIHAFLMFSDFHLLKTQRLAGSAHGQGTETSVNILLCIN